MSHGSIHPYPPGLVSGSSIKSCSWISSWARMLSSGHLAWSQACPLYAAPQSSHGSPRRLVCVVGNGLRPHSLCRYACTGQPAPYTKGGPLEVWVTRPPTMPHHRLPMRGTRDGRCCSRSARTGHWAHRPSPPHATTQCIAAQRGIGSHRPLRSSHLCSAASLFGSRYKKAHLEHTTSSSAYNHCASLLHDARSRAAYLGS